ncbi:MAG TPA: serine hydrolase domain-containing protein [Acidimicrobiales bacterium]|nr:serine hydrolase domain-containing protein [Acidimicrobiales bacterium]
MRDERRSRAARETLDARAELFVEATRNFPLPGGVITIADSSGVLAECAFGHADPGGRTPMDPSRRFEIGSISKLFTSLVVNRLVDEGRLRLDETLAEVLPWARLGPTSGTVTVARLLNHTSGLCVGADALADDAGEIVNSRRCVDAATAPVRFHYSNLGYLVLGEMVRARSGRRLSDLVAEQWLDPLGMRHALAHVSQTDRSSLAVGSWPLRPDRPWAPGDPLDVATFFEVDSASGNVAARGTDMAALMAALLVASRHDPVGDDGAPVLSNETFSRITSSLAPSGEPTYTVAGVDAVEDSRYGMGINVERIGGHFCVSHGGGMVGYSTFMLVDCDAGVGVSVLTNANGDTLASHILARVVHADMTRRLDGRQPATGITLESRVWTLADERIGPFASTSSGEMIDVRREGDGVRVRAQGHEGELFELPSGRYVTTHPGLRRFHLDWSDGRWVYGGEIFAATSAVPSPSKQSENAGLAGHYRTFSPWFPEFRIIEREGRTLLVAPGGVEAPGEEVVLVELGNDEYRLGEDPWLPERLRVLARRDGEVVSVERDGCVYSRTFSA